MKPTPANLWSVPVYLPYLQPALTDEALASAERKLGVILPKSLVDLLRTQNGGYLRLTLPDLPHTLIAGIGPHFPSLTDFDWAEDQGTVSFPLAGLVPFDGDGHWHLCLDYRKNPHQPAVSYIDVECDSQEVVARSFDEYLSRLEVEVGQDHYVLNGIADLTAFLRALEQVLGVQFSAPNSFNHGYPEHRAQGGTAKQPAWIVLSPNLVPRGFVRSNHPRFEELRDHMVGDGLRYPELPETSYLLWMTGNHIDRVLAACASLGVSALPLESLIRG